MLLFVRLVLLDLFFNLQEMPAYRFFARFDDGLETQCLRGWTACFPGMRFAYRILANVPSQEVKPNVSFMFMKRMGNSRFTWFQFKTHARKPCCCYLFGFLYDCFISMHNQEIVSIPDY